MVALLDTEVSRVDELNSVQKELLQRLDNLEKDQSTIGP
jgi:hypothetical protein